MSGDVQPRKRKDKKKRKDELGLEEPRGTAAALGDGDVFMHSQHDHGTGGHWCAKIIFFSLLAVLISLIGLIILENRGLTELEANSVETKYSGVLEGWIEEPSEDDHYDAHTLDLNHPEEDEHHDTEANYDHEDDDHEDDDHEDDDHEDVDHEDEDHEDEDHEDEDHDDEEDEDHDDEEDDHEEDEDHEDETDNIDDNEDSEENLEDADEESEEKNTYRQYVYDEKDEDDDDDDKSIEEDKDDDDNDQDGDQPDQGFDTGNDPEAESDEDQDDNENDDNSYEYQEAQQASNEHNTEEDNLEDDDDLDGEEDEIEKIEAETRDWESYEEDEKATSRDDDVSNEIRSERSLKDSKEISKENDDDEDEDEGFEDTEDDDEPPVERITTPPAGKPFVEIEEETIHKPIDTLAEEAEYEKKQEELRRQKEEQAEASQIWLKLAVGGALLVATHAVLRRATSSRDAPEPEERSREETPSVIDRRMTLIAEEPPKVASPPQTSRQIVDEEVFKKPAPVVKTAPIVKPNIEEVVKEKAISFVQSKIPDTKDDEDKELYSDEDEEVEEEEEEEVQSKTKLAPQQAQTKEKEEDSEPEEVPDDVEIIEDEQIEEELEEEEDEVEEEISDVDDAELLSRLEAKYGRLPEPERPGKQHKDGGNSIEDQWPGEPSDPYWREQLDLAEEELRQGSWALCEKLVSAPQLSDSGRARWILAKALDATAEAKRDNVLLSKAISAYLNLLKMNERISDKKLVEVAQRTIDRIQFRGTYLNAEPIYRLLIRRFPNDVNYRNNLTISFLMANRADLAEEVLKETLKLWPHDRIALAHHGFVLKNQHNKLEEAVVALQKALEGDSGRANEARFYYHLGDALLSLGRFDEAHEVHKRGTKLGHFLSPSQRSLYNVPRLKSSPWWPVEHTPYVKLARTLENSWREILKEGELAKALYEKEKEGLKERGEWSQLDIFVRGREIPGRCKTAPVTCSIVRSEVAAAGCRRGQIKFSAIEPGTHIRPHVGPTNCRLRMHLGLKNTKDTYIRVDKETRQWQVGKTFIFDDSFEHEVWHNGTGSRLVLIVDLWHPQLTPQERKQLPAI